MGRRVTGFQSHGVDVRLGPRRNQAALSRSIERRGKESVENSVSINFFST